MRKKIVLAAALALLLLGAAGLTGCGSDGGASIGKSGEPPAQSQDGQNDAGDSAGGENGSGGTEEPVLSDFETEDLNGDVVHREDVLGKNRLNMVNVWATWCGYCVKEIPSLQKLNDKYADQGFGVVGLLTDGVDLQNFDPQKGELKLLPDNIDQAKKIMEKSKADYPVILPDLNLLYEVVAGVSGYPTTFFTDENGKLVGSVYEGMKSEEFWEQEIEKLLSELPEDQK